MVNNISGALNAYQQALSRVAAKSPMAEVAPSSAEGSFKDMVQGAVSSAVDISKNSERMSIQGLQGKADIQDVVLAVSNAAVALETVVAVRDSAIKAYKEIMTMPI